MSNYQLHTAISQPRYSRYFLACADNKRKAMMLYRANLKLSRELYGVIGMFEIILRNSIDRHLTTKKGNRWLEEAAEPGGYLDSSGCEHSFHSIQEAIQSLGILYTHDRLIAELTFGFWRYQFARKEFAASGSTLLEIFPNRPFGTRQKDVFHHLIKINEVRNRIAHYEPICFDGNVISTERILRRYNLILALFGWLGCNRNKILYGIDGVLKAINLIN